MSDNDMTLRQWQWHYRDQMATACVMNGVDKYTLDNAMERMHVPPFDGYGVGLTVTNDWDRDALPVDSLIQVGVPDRPNEFGVFVKKRGIWYPLVGVFPQLGRGVEGVLLSVGGKVITKDWITAAPTAEDAREVRRFKALAYKVGMEIKREHDWCATFDNIVSERVGLTRDVLRVHTDGDHSIGDEVSPIEAAALPVGTILRRANQTADRSAWFQRTATAANVAGTVRVLGWGNLANFARLMTIVAFPDPNGDAPGFDVGMYEPRVWDALPPGTVFLYNGSRFMVCANHTATTESEASITRSGRYGRTDFGTSLQEARVVSFPITTGGTA